MMSFSERARRRGAMTEARFLEAMRERGFSEIEPREGAMFEFSHPEAPGRVFFMAMRRGDTFSRALCRIAGELEAMRSAA
jgi:hypothetical protein